MVALCRRAYSTRHTRASARRFAKEDKKPSFVDFWYFWSRKSTPAFSLGEKTITCQSLRRFAPTLNLSRRRRHTPPCGMCQFLCTREPAKRELRACFGGSKPYEAAVGFAPRRTCGENPHPLFLWKRRRKEKATKKKRREKLSPSAECDKGSAPLTAPPLKRQAKLLVVSPKPRHHLRESARFPRAAMFARAIWGEAV